MASEHLEEASVTVERPTPGELERRLLGDVPRWTREEASAAAGISVDSARRLWRALGFADVGGAAAFTDADVDALTRLRGLVDDGTLDEASALQLVRAVGSTMARLAEWETETVAELVERRVGVGEGTSRLATAYGIAERVVPQFRELQAYAWQRHLAAAALCMERLGSAEVGLLAAPLTVGFADLVGFTRLSRRLKGTALADLVERFEARAGDRVAAHQARVVKTLGDSVLFVAVTSRQGVDVALGLIADVSAEPGMPDLRVGVATGTVLTRLGDVYGEVVNRASRLTSVAKRNRVVVDEATAAALAGDPELMLRPLRPRSVRGLGLTSSCAVAHADRRPPAPAPAPAGAVPVVD